MVTQAAVSFDAIAPRRNYNPVTGTFEGEHAYIAGITRSGKTYLATRLADRRPFVVVHDAKGTFERNVSDNLFHPDLNSLGWRSFSSLDALIVAVDAAPQEHPRVIYSPTANELDDEGTQERFFAWVFRRGKTTLLVDELTAIARPGYLPRSLRHIYARGIELGLEVIGLTQDPVLVPNLVLSQTQHRYCFYLAIESHREKMAGVMPITADEIRGLRVRMPVRINGATVYVGEFFWWRYDRAEAVGPIYVGDRS